MLNQKTINRINEVDSVQDFNELLDIFQLSEADKATKEEAIRELKARKSVFYVNPVHTSKNVYEDIKAGAADIDDII